MNAAVGDHDNLETQWHREERAADDHRLAERLEGMRRRLENFTDCQFVAYLDGGLKQMRSGSWRVSLLVPSEFAHPLVNLGTAGDVLLSVDVQSWTPVVQEQTGARPAE